MQTVHFLHVGKTGGTAIKYALREFTEAGDYMLKLHDHDFTLLNVPDGDKVIFFVRDPIARFISGFYSRQRQGQPRYHVPWTAAEKAAFARFATPSELASALSCERDEQRNAATYAMKNIGHVKSSLWDWLGSEAYFQTRRDAILLVGFQERLNEDFQILKEKLGLPHWL